MIIDKVSNWNLYFKSAKFNEIFDELNKIDSKTKNGIYAFDGYEFRVMSYETKTESKIYEAHKTFVDIQILLQGSERIKVYAIDEVKEIQPYDGSTDCVFYEPIGEFHSDILIHQGYMGVFFPQDIHNPQLAAQNPQKIKKVVIKVHEKFFTSN